MCPAGFCCQPENLVPQFNIENYHSYSEQLAIHFICNMSLTMSQAQLTMTKSSGLTSRSSIAGKALNFAPLRNAISTAHVTCSPSQAWTELQTAR